MGGCRKGVMGMSPGTAIRCVLRSVLISVVVAMLAFGSSAGAAEEIRRNQVELRDSYRVHLDAVRNSSFGLPLVVESSERGDKAHVDVYGILDQPFSDASDVLKLPANWCDILSISPNVKACVYRKQRNDWLLNFYVGRKVYKEPEDARRVVSRFRLAAQRPDYLDIVLAADTGPYGTSNYRMRFEAIPATGGKTFVHVSFGYGESAALRAVEKVYFATLGRDKTGFTVEERDKDGKPVYVGGRRGAIERNTVRYYFAILSYIKMKRFPAEQRFSRSAGEWYDLTSRFRKLDFGLDRKEYLDIKARERRNQLALQQRMDAGLE